MNRTFFSLEHWKRFSIDQQLWVRAFLPVPITQNCIRLLLICSSTRACWRWHADYDDEGLVGLAKYYVGLVRLVKVGFIMVLLMVIVLFAVSGVMVVLAFVFAMFCLRWFWCCLRSVCCCHWWRCCCDFSGLMTVLVALVVGVALLVGDAMWRKKGTKETV